MSYTSESKETGLGATVAATLAAVALLAAGAGWTAIPVGSAPDHLSLETGLWLGWWMATITVVRAVLAIALARATRGQADPATARRFLRLAPRLVRPLVAATLWASASAAPVGAEDDPVPAAELAIMRRVDEPDPAPVEPAPIGTALPPEPPVAEADPLAVAAEPGDHLWALAAAALTDHLERPPTLIELNEYWRAVIAANLEHLISGDPNLIHPGEAIRLPSPTPEPSA